MDLLFFIIVFGMTIGALITVFVVFSSSKMMMAVVMLMLVIVGSFMLSSGFFNDPGIIYIVMEKSERVLVSQEWGNGTYVYRSVEDGASIGAPDRYHDSVTTYVLLDGSRASNQPLALLFFMTGVIATFFALYAIVSVITGGRK